ncbi:MAG TPA: beta-galactosidase, partial [Armatimonadota bacterium]|nr:beta-galactosidase [Armatimonadota bacterium]
TMASLGLNTFRLFIAWDRIERRHGVKDFSAVDHAFDLAAKYGLHVVANVGGTFANLQAIYPPRWLYTECGCQILQPSIDAPIKAPGPRLKLCYDDPVYQREATAFIREAVQRYRSHPNLLAWAGWNEPRVSFCFCPHTLALYRNWLQEKYTDLEQLSRAWSTEFPLYFNSWDEVLPQIDTGFEFGGYLPWLDWNAFCDQNRTDKFNLIYDTIKAEDETHPVVSHLCGPYDADIFGREDVLGTSIYTYFCEGNKRYEISDQELLRILHWFSALMRTGYRQERPGDKYFWVMETEAGPVSWVHGLMPRTYSGRKMNARDMLFIGNGARCVLRWLYRSRVTDAQAGEFNLVGWDGTVTERAAEYGSLGKFLNEHIDLFTTNTPHASSIAVLADDRKRVTLLQAEEIQHKYDGSENMLFTCLAHAGYQADPVCARQVLNGELSQYKVLFVPIRPYVDADLANQLELFVRNGGLLVVESPFATKNMNAIHWEKTPGAGLDKVFGAQVYDMEKLLEPDCGGVVALDFKAIVRPQDCSIEATFADGKPSIISHAYGKGKAVMFASIVSRPYTWGNGENL